MTQIGANSEIYWYKEVFLIKCNVKIYAIFLNISLKKNKNWLIVKRGCFTAYIFVTSSGKILQN